MLEGTTTAKGLWAAAKPRQLLQRISALLVRSWELADCASLTRYAPSAVRSDFLAWSGEELPVRLDPGRQLLSRVWRDPHAG